MENDWMPPKKPIKEHAKFYFIIKTADSFFYFFIPPFFYHQNFCEPCSFSLNQNSRPKKFNRESELELESCGLIEE